MDTEPATAVAGFFRTSRNARLRAVCDRPRWSSLAAPFFVYPLFLAKVLCFCLFACAFNLLLGSVGLLSLGHAAFFGAAAYVTGHALKEWGLPFELAALLGTGVGALLGLAFGYRLDPPLRASTSR